MPGRERRVIKPVTVSVTVPQRREDVYEFLDVLANHEVFTDHMLIDWKLSGPPSGVGAKARMRIKKPGRADWIDLEVLAARQPEGSTEEAVSGGGKRHTRGTYALEELPGGGTRISFEFAWLEAPLSERLFAPLTRAIMRRGNGRSMERLAEQLSQGS